MNLDTNLLNNFESFYQARPKDMSLIVFLHSLLEQFDMDQAVFCELNESSISPILSTDRGKNKLSISEDQLLFFHNMLLQTIREMEPKSHLNRSAKDVSSLKLNELFMGCHIFIPLSKKPAQVILLANQKPILKDMGQNALINLKAAYRASILPPQQRDLLHALEIKSENLQPQLNEEKAHGKKIASNVDNFMSSIALSGSLRELTQYFERKVITEMLAEPYATQSSVARKLNISVRTLQRILSRSDGVGPTQSL